MFIQRQPRIAPNVAVYLLTRYQEAQISVEKREDWLSYSFAEYSVDNATVREIDEVINVPNIGPVVVTRHALERFVERFSDGVPMHPWKALCSKLLCSAVTKAQLPESVVIQKAKNMHRRPSSGSMLVVKCTLF